MRLALNVFITLLLAACNLSGICQSSKDQPELQSILNQFQNAIEMKDSVSFNKLFFDKNVKFIGIMSQKTEESIKKKHSDFQGVSVSTSLRFINQICSSAKKHEETFYNETIRISEVIATVSFDYSYQIDKKMVQWGHETWNMVFVEGNWLISDVVFSIHFPSVEPCPFSP